MATYSSCVTLFRLSDGTPVMIRPIRPSDRALFPLARRRFSDKTMYQRFMSPKPVLSNSELRYLTEVDGFDHVAYVAVRADDPRYLVAVARFVRLKHDPATAEAAIVVADAEQGQGLGKKLALLLADAARESGIERFMATMLSDNPAAHALMRTLALRLEDHGHDQGVHELVAELAA
jgi:RimJ/RimL family protein N-acetyltransferase